MERDINKESLGIAKFLEGHQLFFVGSERDNSVLIALHPSYHSATRTIAWWDTNIERVKQIGNLYAAGERGVLFFTDTKKIDYRFLPMTLNIYNNYVKQKISGKSYNDLNDLITAFEDTAY